MLLTFKTTLQLNSLVAEVRARRTLILPHCTRRMMHIPSANQGPKSIGAPEHSAQFFKCLEPITTPFCGNCKGLYTFRGERGNKTNLMICNGDTATLGHTAVNTAFSHITLVVFKTQSNNRTCTERHPMADFPLTDPARTTHPGQLWANAYVLTQRTT